MANTNMSFEPINDMINAFRREEELALSRFKDERINAFNTFVEKMQTEFKYITGEIKRVNIHDLEGVDQEDIVPDLDYRGEDKKNYKVANQYNKVFCDYLDEIKDTIKETFSDEKTRDVAKQIGVKNYKTLDIDTLQDYIMEAYSIEGTFIKYQGKHKRRGYGEEMQFMYPIDIPVYRKPNKNEMFNELGLIVPVTEEEKKRILFERANVNKEEKAETARVNMIKRLRSADRQQLVLECCSKSIKYNKEEDKKNDIIKRIVINDMKKRHGLEFDFDNEEHFTIPGDDEIKALIEEHEFNDLPSKKKPMKPLFNIHPFENQHDFFKRKVEEVRIYRQEQQVKMKERLESLNMEEIINECILKDIDGYEHYEKDILVKLVIRKTMKERFNTDAYTNDPELPPINKPIIYTNPDYVENPCEHDLQPNQPLTEKQQKIIQERKASASPSPVPTPPQTPPPPPKKKQQTPPPSQNNEETIIQKNINLYKDIDEQQLINDCDFKGIERDGITDRERLVKLLLRKKLKEYYNIDIYTNDPDLPILEKPYEYDDEDDMKNLASPPKNLSRKEFEQYLMRIRLEDLDLKDIQRECEFKKLKGYESMDKETIIKLVMRKDMKERHDVDVYTDDPDLPTLDKPYEFTDPLNLYKNSRKNEQAKDMMKTQLEKLNKKELIIQCKLKGIKGYTTLKKEAIIKLIMRNDMKEKHNVEVFTNDPELPPLKTPTNTPVPSPKANSNSGHQCCGIKSNKEPCTSTKTKEVDGKYFCTRHTKGKTTPSPKQPTSTTHTCCGTKKNKEPCNIKKTTKAEDSELYFCARHMKEYKSKTPTQSTSYEDIEKEKKDEEVDKILEVLEKKDNTQEVSKIKRMKTNIKKLDIVENNKDDEIDEEFNKEIDKKVFGEDNNNTATSYSEEEDQCVDEESDFGEEDYYDEEPEDYY